MKTERRHDLETNWLAQYLSDGIEKVKPYSGVFLSGLALCGVLWVAGSWWNSTSVAAEKKAWEAYAKARNSSDPELMTVHKLAMDDRYVGTHMQAWAQITWADRQVLLAAQGYLRDRSEALSRLQGVVGIYDSLSSTAPDEQIRDRAHFSLGRLYELQNKLPEARQQYGLVTGALVELARERAAVLDSEDVQQTCQWLATAKLPQRDSTGGQGASGERPAFAADLPAADGGAADDGADDAAEDAANEDAQERLRQLLRDFKVEDPAEEPAANSAEDAAADDNAEQDSLPPTSGEDAAPAEEPAADSPDDAAVETDAAAAGA